MVALWAMFCRHGGSIWVRFESVKGESLGETREMARLAGVGETSRVKVSENGRVASPIPTRKPIWSGVGCRRLWACSLQAVRFSQYTAYGGKYGIM
jgi:hypothetical protein